MKITVDVSKYNIIVTKTLQKCSLDDKCFLGFTSLRMKHEETVLSQQFYESRKNNKNVQVHQFISWIY